MVTADEADDSKVHQVSGIAPGKETSETGTSSIKQLSHSGPGDAPEATMDTTISAIPQGTPEPPGAREPHDPAARAPRTTT